MQEEIIENIIENVKNIELTDDEQEPITKPKKGRPKAEPKIKENGKLVRSEKQKEAWTRTLELRTAATEAKKLAKEEHMAKIYIESLQKKKAEEKEFSDEESIKSIVSEPHKSKPVRKIIIKTKKKEVKRSVKPKRKTKVIYISASESESESDSGSDLTESSESEEEQKPRHKKKNKAGVEIARPVEVFDPDRYFV